MRARLLPLLLCAAAVAAACGGGDTQQAGGAAGGRGAFPAMDVKTITIVPKPIPQTSEFVATIRSLRSTNIQPQVDGIVRQIMVMAGDRVRAGQALVQIDEVSRRLATLISEISAATTEQTQSAARISKTMEEILRITELTTDGTRRTADSTARLAAMAAQLKQSVAGFKLS